MTASRSLPAYTQAGPSVKKHLMSWVTGRTYGMPRPKTGAASIVVEKPADLGWLADGGWIGPQTVVFAYGAPEWNGPGRVVPCEGCCSTGGELRVGSDFYLQFQGYVMLGFLTVLGPTAVRRDDAEDREALERAAAEARFSGVFPAALDNPVVQVADVGLVEGVDPHDGPRLRAYADRDGVISVSPGGPRLGSVGDGFEAAAHSWAVAPRPAPVEGLGYWLNAVQARQLLTAQGHVPDAVSGFGGRFFGDGDLTFPTDPASPVLMRSGPEYFVGLPESGRTFRASPEVARAIEEHLTGAEPSSPEVWPRVRPLLETGSGAPE